MRKFGGSGGGESLKLPGSKVIYSLYFNYTNLLLFLLQRAHVLARGATRVALRGAPCSVEFCWILFCVYCVIAHSNSVN